ncbi:MAG: YCF48-related protein [Candidatus Eisenbacteria bacterium]
MAAALLLALGAVPVIALNAARADEDYVYTWSLPVPQGNALGGCDFEDAATGYAVGPRGTVVTTTDGGATWSGRDLYPGFSTDLEDVLVRGPQHLFAVGEAPGIFESIDGGASWSAVANPSTGRLTDIEVVTGSTLSALGAGGQALRSTDDGATWTALVPPGANDLYEQYWFDASSGYVVGDRVARRTTNGGQSWLALTGVPEAQEKFSEVFFTDAQNGWILGDFFYWQTTNGGASWTQHSSGQALYLGDTVVLGPQRFLVSTNVEGAFIFETTNGGASWTPRLYSGADAFLDFDRTPDGTLIAVTGQGNVFRSTDEGITWTDRTYAAYDGLRANLGAVAIGPAGLGAAGSDGWPPTHWYRTEDGGASWLPQDPAPNIGFTNAISYWDGVHAIAAGDYGKMWRTIDGGLNWTPVNLPNPPQDARGYRMSLPAPGVAFVSVFSQSLYMVCRTTDYGASWESRSTGLPTGVWLAGISFLDANTGFVASNGGATATIYATTNGGASWSPIASAGLPSTTSDMHWTDAQNGVVTARFTEGGIFRTTNGGAVWNQIWAGDVGKLAFASDGLHAAAADQSYLDHGILFVTEDGGASWNPLELPSTATFTSIQAVDDGYWLGGSGSTILKLTRANPASVDTGALPAAGQSCSLRSRGTAGGSIEIEYELAEPGAIDLSIFDVRGRRIATLDRGERPAGTVVTRAWEGTDAGQRAANGVYFARLETPREARAIKIVLRR